MNKTIVITGASSGIGKATAKYFAEKGWSVIATMRSPEKEVELKTIENVKIIQLDVTNEASIIKAVDASIEALGHVDVVLNNAGFALMGPFEFATREEIKKQFDVNVMGLFDVTRAFLPHFRENKSGTFINISSVGGKTTFPYMSLYHGTKYAVEGFTESLNFELSQLGIRAKLIEPDGVDTNFSGSSMVSATSDTIKDYNSGTNKFMSSLQNSGGLGNNQAIDIAKVIYEAATNESDRIRFIAGDQAEQLIARRNEIGDELFVAGMMKEWFE